MTVSKTSRSTARKSTHAKPARSRSASKTEAIAQLTEDHARVKKLFKQYEKLAQDEGDEAEREALAAKICAELTAHATAEEEIFYPAAREVLGDHNDLIDEAEVEHESAKELIAQIQSSTASDPHYDARVKVLGEYINHHVEEEEGEIFPKVRRARLDTEALGEQIAARKAEILEQSTVEVPH